MCQLQFLPTPLASHYTMFSIAFSALVQRVQPRCYRCFSNIDIYTSVSSTYNIISSPSFPSQMPLSFRFLVIFYFFRKQHAMSSQVKIFHSNTFNSLLTFLVMPMVLLLHAYLINDICFLDQTGLHESRVHVQHNNGPQ